MKARSIVSRGGVNGLRKEGGLMSVYVDASRRGRMRMCHMVADSTKELFEMADRLGVDRGHIQAEGTYREHFEICKSKRALAVKFGAKEISSRTLEENLMGKLAGQA